MSRWVVRKRADVPRGMRWTVAPSDGHVNSWTGRASWVEAMMLVAKFDKEVYGC